MIQLHIKKVAASKGMSLKDVCEKCGYKSLPSFYRQINNPESISMRTLIKIADVIGCDVADFFIVSDQKESLSSPLVCPHCGKEVCVTLSVKE